MSGLVHAVHELLAVIEDENRALSSHVVTSHDMFTSRKLQLLRTLMAGLKVTTDIELRSARQAALALSGALARNRHLLDVHVNAVRDVAAIIVDSIKQHESDGTYQRVTRRGSAV